MKTRIKNLFMVLALIAGILPTLAQVTNLGIAPAGNQTVLFWPATATNDILQSATNLSSPNWVTVSDAVPVTAVSVTNIAPTMFFRLFNTNPPAGMALIPAGSFTMGDTLDDESDAMPTNVYVPAFFMDTNLVTSNQWAAVYAYATNQGYSFTNAGAGKGINYPVETVDWYDCVKWCNARSQQAGLTPVYYTDVGMTQIYTHGEMTPYVNWTANGYRLPTEAEWEKAARGGLSGQRFPWGNTISESQAYYIGDTNDYNYDLGPNGDNTIGLIGGYPYTSLVGSFAPNGYGIFDMAGNLYEWCWDFYGTPYGQPTANNPTGPATGSYHVSRGGDWEGLAPGLRSASRNAGPPNAAVIYIGFRCVIGL